MTQLSQPHIFAANPLDRCEVERRDEELLPKLAEDRRNWTADVERYRHPQVAWALKSLGRIEVVASG